MALKDHAVTDADLLSSFQSWREAITDNYEDKISELQQKERDAIYALKSAGLQERVEQIKDEYWQTRLQGLASILGELHKKRCDSAADYKKYEIFLARYKEQLEKAEGKL